MSSEISPGPTPETKPSVRAKPDTLSWPLTADQVESLDRMLRELYEDLKQRTIRGSSNILVLNGDGVAGDPTIFLTGSLGLVDDYYLRRATRRIMGAAWRPPANTGSTLETIGHTGNALTVSGTATETVDARRTWLGLATAAAIGASAGISQGTNPGHVRYDHLPFFSVRVRPTTDVTSVRFWAGFFNLSAMALPLDVDTLTGHGLGFRFSTVAGDSGFKGVVHDGTNQTTTTDLGSVITNTEYVLSLRVITSTTVTFRVQTIGGATVESSLTVPAGALGQTMHVVYDQYVTQAASARSWDFGGGDWDAGQDT